jgi:hypothetical protein
MFPDLANDPNSLVPTKHRQATNRALAALADQMVTADGMGPDVEDNVSTIPAVYTYFGQFLDHDLTLQQYRGAVDERALNEIAPQTDIPRSTTDILKHLKNARKNVLNLDSLYGLETGDNPATSRDEAAKLYDGAYFRLGSTAPFDPSRGGEFSTEHPCQLSGEFDIPRPPRDPYVADTRNDDNLIISQLHCAFLRFHNRATDWVLSYRSVEKQKHPSEAAFGEARRLVQLHFQHAVCMDYLSKICDPTVLEGVKSKFRRAEPGLWSTKNVVPVEFATAGFRFGHSMIRIFYDFNPNFSQAAGRMALLERLFDLTTKGGLDGYLSLPAHWVIDWSRFVSGEVSHRCSFAINHFIAQRLNVSEVAVQVSRLAYRNLMRGLVRRLPTGQAIAKKLNLPRIESEQILSLIKQKSRQPIVDAQLDVCTPLWFYVLAEAHILGQGGNFLGPVGTTIVAETLYGLLAADRTSCLRTGWSPSDGLKFRDGKPVESIADILKFAGALNQWEDQFKL